LFAEIFLGGLTMICTKHNKLHKLMMIVFLLISGCAVGSNKNQQLTKTGYAVIAEVDSLYQLIVYKDSYIDSLHIVIDFLNSQVDSLVTELEITNSKVLVNDTFTIPYRYSFAGVELDFSNDRVRQKLQSIFNTERRSARTYIPRSSIYFDLFDEVIESYGLHPDIKYLAVAESHLNYMAYSPASAAGIWQFIPSTARSFGLKIDSYVDERRNIFKATDAACRYLIQAHRELARLGVDDWLITMAAYNSGVGNMSRTIREQGAREFSQLIMRVEETNNYIWRAIAIKMIFEFEEEIFVNRFERMPKLLETAKLVQVEVNGYHDLLDWAAAQGTNITAIWELNPWINISRTRTGRYSQINHLIIAPGTHELLLPITSEPDATRVAAANTKLLERNNAPFLTGPGQTYKVVRGDTLNGLARRFGVSVENIRRWNNLSGNTIYAGQTLRFQGTSTTATTSNTPARATTSTTTSAPTTTSSTTNSTNVYIVQSGDTLRSIAEKLGTTSANLISKNNLTSVKRNGMDIVIIHPGQKLLY
jgi:membrane-bound lytic murein transglycosylase D